MNDRIRQLIKQAGVYYNDSDYDHSDLEALQKFAKLIIKEVTDLLDREQWNRGQDWICKDGDRIIERVESHFGVEE
jgi:hypothetical protein